MVNLDIHRHHYHLWLLYPLCNLSHRIKSLMRSLDQCHLCPSRTPSHIDLYLLPHPLHRSSTTIRLILPIKTVIDILSEKHHGHISHNPKEALRVPHLHSLLALPRRSYQHGIKSVRMQQPPLRALHLHTHLLRHILLPPIPKMISVHPHLSLLLLQLGINPLIDTHRVSLD
jgi:hypothetical protein